MSRKEVADEMTYRVVFTKEGEDWTVIAPDVHPAHSWGPTLKSATEHIKEAIASSSIWPRVPKRPLSWTPNTRSKV